MKKAKEQAENERDIQKGVADIAIKESVSETYKTHPIEEGIEEPSVLVVKRRETEAPTNSLLEINDFVLKKNHGRIDKIERAHFTDKSEIFQNMKNCTCALL